MKCYKRTYFYHSFVLLPILFSSFGCETATESVTKDTIFIGLIVLEIAFLAFVFITRYVTRNDDHHHDEEDDYDEI
ncbi:MAG: hypothetical protein AAF611_06240 [Bacteroidota bacterium]